MAYEYGLPNRQGLTYRQNVVRIAVEGAIARSIKCRSVRFAMADVVEQYNPVIPLEGWDNVSPHVLIASVAVRQNHRPGPSAQHPDVIALQIMQFEPH